MNVRYRMAGGGKNRQDFVRVLVEHLLPKRSGRNLGQAEFFLIPTVYRFTDAKTDTADGETEDFQ